MQILAPEPGAHPAFELCFKDLLGRKCLKPGRLAGPAGSLFLSVLRTARSISLSPAASFSSFSMEGGMLLPLLYSLLLAGPFLLLDLELKAIFAGDGSFSWPVGIFALLAAPAVYLYLRAQAVHLALVLKGSAARPFRSTFRVVAYSNASVSPLLAIPFVGDFLFLMAGTIVEATGIRMCHRTSPAGAVIVELAPVLALLLSFLGILFLRFLWWSQARA